MKTPSGLYPMKLIKDTWNTNRFEYTRNTGLVHLVSTTTESRMAASMIP